MMNGLPIPSDFARRLSACALMVALTLSATPSVRAVSSSEFAPPEISTITDDGLEALRVTMKRMDDAILSCDAQRVMAFASKDIRFHTIDASGPVEDKAEYGFDAMYESMKDVYAGLQDYTYKRTHVKMALDRVKGTATSYDVIQETARLSNKPIFIRSEQRATFKRQGGRWIMVDLQSRITECRDINIASTP